MAERCLTLGCPEAVRLAKQDPCSGEKIAGECQGYVLTCIRNWSIEPIVREGEAAEFVSDCGNMVVRDKQDDQLLGYAVSFETSSRSNELEALITGNEVIESGGLSIGSYKLASNLACDTPSDDPRFIVEIFYKLSKCVTGADHVRVVLPMAQFKVTELDREGTITYYRYTAETGIALANAIATGPYGDFPADVAAFLAAQDPDEYTAGFDFEESITITGNCGCIEVPDDAPEDPEELLFVLGVSIDGANNQEVWSVNSDGTNPQQVAVPPGADIGGIAQPLGRNVGLSEIVFSHNDGVDAYWNVYDNSGLLIASDATPYPGAGVSLARQGGFNPASNEVLYVTSNAGLPELISVTVPGAVETVIQTGDDGYVNPIFSPDGTRIAFFVLLTGGTTYRIRITDLVGGLIAESPDLGGPLASQSLAWAEDSSEVYLLDLQAQVYPASELISVDAVTGVVTTLAVLPSAGVVPQPFFDVFSITADGNYIVGPVRDNVVNTEFAVWTVPTVGGAPVQRSTNLQWFANSPWIDSSPDSTRAAVLNEVASTNFWENSIAIIDLTAVVPTAPITNFYLPGNEDNQLYSVSWQGTPLTP